MTPSEQTDERMKTVKITKQQSVGMAEEWDEWFTCPNCKEADITRSYSFCPHCGVKLEHVYEWQKAVK